VADEGKLRVVLDNLVSNAVKFSPEGGAIQVTVTPNGSDVYAEVHDEGPGVAPADRDKVFDWFFQGERPQAGRIKGSGLGLAIARELVAAHGGTIEAMDGPGGRFRVTLPQLGPRREAR
jgi:two-component system sensor histidine kinase GlrK